MAELSMWWSTSGTPTGHQVASYTQVNLATLVEILGVCSGQFGVAPNYLFELAVTDIGGGTVRVASGGALVDGHIYKNDSNLDKAIDSTPTVRADRVVLRADWAAFKLSVEIKKGTDGSTTPPSLTQTPGTTYEISLAKVDVTAPTNFILS
jgi:hypothetical protein